MIFVTVGTGSFDLLIMEIDKIAKDTPKKIICQIGNGKYIPKNCKWFRYENNLNDYYKKANLIISHGGAGTIFMILEMKKKAIGVNNTHVLNNHQHEILEELSRNKNLIWCKEIKELLKLIKSVNKFKFIKYKKPDCYISREINEYLLK